MWKLLLVPVLLYAAVVAIFFLAQTAMLFPAGSVPAAGPPPPGAERLELEAASGERLHGLLVPGSGPEGERVLLIGFGGNAWNAGDTAAYLHELFPEADILAFHYRGYAPSAGRPGAAALKADALAVHDFARARLRPRRTVAIGFSIGSGVAAHLARHRPLDGAILVTPFDSLRRVGGGHYPWLPVRLLFRHELDAAGDLAGTRIPVAILAAERDSLIVPERTEALRRAVPNLAFDRTLAGAGHNDIYDRPAFRRAMREALAALVDPAPPAMLSPRR